MNKGDRVRFTDHPHSIQTGMHGFRGEIMGETSTIDGRLYLVALDLDLTGPVLDLLVGDNQRARDILLEKFQMCKLRLHKNPGDERLALWCMDFEIEVLPQAA